MTINNCRCFFCLSLYLTLFTIYIVSFFIHFLFCVDRKSKFIESKWIIMWWLRRAAHSTAHSYKPRTYTVPWVWSVAFCLIWCLNSTNTIYSFIAHTESCRNEIRFRSALIIFGLCAQMLCFAKSRHVTAVTSSSVIPYSCLCSCCNAIEHI